jgi:hypothetical protein
MYQIDEFGNSAGIRWECGAGTLIRGEFGGTYTCFLKVEFVGYKTVIDLFVQML